jgi:hypothetical protein
MKNSNAKISQPVGVGLQHLDPLSVLAERKQRCACIQRMPSPLDAVGAGSVTSFSRPHPPQREKAYQTGKNVEEKPS